MIDLSASPLVETAWLAAHLGEHDLRIVDARWTATGTGRELYQHSHLPGAIHLDWDQDLSWTDERGVRNLLLPSELFAKLMEVVGIGDQTRVIAYAETDHSGAARLWWALRFYGHEQVAVLNDGWTKWVAEERPVSNQVPHPQPARFTPQPDPRWLAVSSEIEQAIHDPASSVRVVDTRPAEQYTGQAIWTPNGSLFLPPGQSWIALADQRVMRGGHIPKALHLHASRLLNPTDWTYLPPEALQTLAQGVGLSPEQRVITYCGVGISASLGLFALYLAGYGNVALYDASWEEWGTDATLPIEGT